MGKQMPAAVKGLWRHHPADTHRAAGRAPRCQYSWGLSCWLQLGLGHVHHQPMQINFPPLNCAFPVDLQHLRTWQAQTQCFLHRLQMMYCQREQRRGPVACVVARKKSWPIGFICSGHAPCWVPRQAAMLAPCLQAESPLPPKLHAD